MIEFAIAALPLLLLIAALLFGFYPGCETAMRWATRLALRARPVVAVTRGWRPHLLASHAVRGGLLLAFSLSGRAPPA